MGVVSKQDPILQALDDFFMGENQSGPEYLSRIAKLMNSPTTPTSKIQQKLENYFSYNSSTRIKKFMDLIEFLSIYSAEKFAEIINAEKFVETFATVLMEPDFQDPMLNILKIWFDRYEHNKEQVNRVFDLIENLPNFGITLPFSYKSKYEGLDIDALELKVEEKVEPEKPTRVRSQPESSEMEIEVEGESLISRGETAVTKAKRLLNDTDFEAMPRDYKETTLKILTEEIGEILIFMDIDDDYSNGKSKKKTVAEDLRRYQTLLRRKMEGEDIELVGFAKSEPVYGPQPLHATSERISELIKNFPEMMDINELMTYKTEMCPKEMKCKYAPTRRKGFQLGAMKEIQCPYWHSMQDKRRPVFDERKHIMYTPNDCKNQEECRNEDKCRNTHNFFEKTFHPRNYKMKKCNYGDGCKSGKYCPNYHSQAEKEAWVEILRDELELNVNEDIGEDEDEWASEPNKMTNEAYENARHLPPEPAIPRDDNPGSYSPKNDYKRYKDRYPYENKSDPKEVRVDRPKDKELLSKLVIRKKFVAPVELSGLMNNFPYFYGHQSNLGNHHGQEQLNKAAPNGEINKQ